MVFQQAALFDSLTVEKMLLLLYQHFDLPRSRIQELVTQVEMVGLAGVGSRHPAELSGECVSGLPEQLRLTSRQPCIHQRFYYTMNLMLVGLHHVSTVIEDLIRQLQCTRGICSTAIVTTQESTIHRTADRIVFLYQ